jgi:predicted metal-binding membrane protein
MEKSNDLLSGAPGISFWVAEMFGWLIMSAAMMLPLTIAPVRHVAFRSLWKRRHRAVFCFLLGVALIWTAVGLLWIAILGLHGASAFGTVASSLVIAVAAGWQFTPAKRRALLACHRTVPLAVDRWRADLDCLRYGLLHGRHCLLSCWALMLAAMLLHPGLPAMFGASVVALTERYRPQRLRTASLLALALAVSALISQQA